MSYWNQVAVQKSLTDLCEDRKQIVHRITDYYRAVESVDDMMKTIFSTGLGRNVMPHSSLEEAIKEVDRAFWRQAFEKTGFMQLLDAKTAQTFHRDLQENTPVFNLANVQSTFLDLSLKADQMFNDGIVNVFRRLSNHYKSNDVFKVNNKIVMEYMIERWHSGPCIRYGSSADEINDIDRVFKTLDGKKHEPRALSTAMNETFCKGLDFEDDTFKAKAFKNGNMHLWFKRTDLLDRVNLIITKQYEENTLGKGSRE